MAGVYGISRCLYDGASMAFLTQLDSQSARKIESTICSILLDGKDIKVHDNVDIAFFLSTQYPYFIIMRTKMWQMSELCLTMYRVSSSMISRICCLTAVLCRHCFEYRMSHGLAIMSSLNSSGLRLEIKR